MRFFCSPLCPRPPCSSCIPSFQSLPSGNVCLAFSVSLSLTFLYSPYYTHTRTHTYNIYNTLPTPRWLSGCWERRQQCPWCSDTVTSLYSVSCCLTFSNLSLFLLFSCPRIFSFLLLYRSILDSNVIVK